MKPTHRTREGHLIRVIMVKQHIYAADIEDEIFDLLGGGIEEAEMTKKRVWDGVLGYKYAFGAEVTRVERGSPEFTSDDEDRLEQAEAIAKKLFPDFYSQGLVAKKEKHPIE
jgi:hypothetical protein